MHQDGMPNRSWYIDNKSQRLKKSNSLDYHHFFFFDLIAVKINSFAFFINISSTFSYIEM